MPRSRSAAPPRRPVVPARPGEPARGERRRALLLAAARDLFLTRGYEATTLDDVVARAGGSKTTVYALFGGKEGLLEALAGDLTRAAEARAALERIDPELPPREALARFGAAALLLLTSRDQVDLLRLAVAQGERFPEIGRAYWRTGRGALRTTLARYLARAAPAGALRIPAVDEAADLFFSLLVDGRMTSLVLGLEVPPDAVRAPVLAEAAVARFWRIHGPDEG